jgi:glycosyltransferase involved in cell wall biosynthesis
MFIKVSLFNIIFFNKALLIFILCFLYIGHFKKSVSTKINIQKDRVNNKSIIANEIKDVLFINGCNPEKLPHPYRYRVLHQMEQLKAGSLESDEFFFLDFNPKIVLNYRVIIFFRCQWTKKVEEAINLAKSLNKKVLFDIDDLVFDTNYTDMHPYIKTLSQKEKKLYDKGVELIAKTLKLCEGAITTNEVLAKELNKYVKNVFVNRNVPSEEMWRLSQNALLMKINKTKSSDIIIGYFSGSISHNPDIEMLRNVLVKILREFKNVKLLLYGFLKVPNFLSEFSTQIIKRRFIDWKLLPRIISNIDINIAPIENIFFNEAKSENKWVEASLVKIPTVSSNYGAFKQVIHHNETGILCSNLNDWYISLKSLINDKLLRKTIGENAYYFCKKKYNTIYTGINLSNYINSIANKHIGFFLPSLGISGGIYVILKHASFLQDKKWDVDLIVPFSDLNTFEFQGHIFNIINLKNMTLNSQYDILVILELKDIYILFKDMKQIFLLMAIIQE